LGKEFEYLLKQLKMVVIKKWCVKKIYLELK
jgi:hypothetical protein